MKAEQRKEREKAQKKEQGEEQGEEQKSQKGIAISDAEWAIMKALWKAGAAKAGNIRPGNTQAGAAQAGADQAGNIRPGNAQAGAAQAGADQTAVDSAAAQKAGLTLRQIDEAVKDHGWGYSTVRTMVGRLVEKGAITADKSRPGNFLYYPAVSEEVCRREEVRSFVDRVFGGSARLLVSALVDDQKLSAEEEAALMAIIDKME